ncbi:MULTISPECIES: LamG domain-containing protein [unclassified Microcoleus]|uniref:LamG domain-containing protein n=1 Tax=unclassified Microcoleus TaxID=2642155 RepID=UPI002FD77BB3
MKKFLTLAALTLATPIITLHNEALAITLGPLPRDVIYSSDGTFDRPNIFFNNPTDTIQISGQTVLGNESTYEARIYFPKGIGAGGFVFNEWTGGYEDKGLAAGLNALIGTNFPFYPGAPLASLTTLVSDTWHHIAFVQGGGSQRLYLDGQMVGTRPAAGDIWNSDGGGFIGALFRDGATASSFIGHLDTLRISNVARYSGNSFEAPTGDLTSDANTQILYNFNLENYYQQDGFTWASDLSGNGRNGRFGTGFADATSPSVVVSVEPSEPVPEPTTVLSTLAFGAVISSWRMKRKQQQKVLN